MSLFLTWLVIRMYQSGLWGLYIIIEGQFNSVRKSMPTPFSTWSDQPWRFGPSLSRVGYQLSQNITQACTQVEKVVLLFYIHIHISKLVRFRYALLGIKQFEGFAQSLALCKYYINGYNVRNGTRISPTLTFNIMQYRSWKLHITNTLSEKVTKCERKAASKNAMPFSPYWSPNQICVIGLSPVHDCG